MLARLGPEKLCLCTQDMPRLPTPLGHFAYCDFRRLPWTDRLSALPLMTAAADFDNSPEAWQRYDGMSARELFRRSGVTQRLYDDAFNPMLLVGLFAPGRCLLHLHLLNAFAKSLACMHMCHD